MGLYIQGFIDKVQQRFVMESNLFGRKKSSLPSLIDAKLGAVGKVESMDTCQFFFLYNNVWCFSRNSKINFLF